MSYEQSQANSKPIIPGEALLHVSSEHPDAVASIEVNPLVLLEIAKAFRNSGKPYNWMKEPEEHEARAKALRAEFEVPLLHGWYNAPAYDGSNTSSHMAPDPLVLVELDEIYRQTPLYEARRMLDIMGKVADGSLDDK